MKKTIKKILAIIISTSMVFTVSLTAPSNFQANVMADVTDSQIQESLVTDFSYDFAYETSGYADGTIRITAQEDGVYKVFWGDAQGSKLKKNGHEYSYLARVIVKDGKGSYNIISDYTAIPEGAETVLVYRKNVLQYVYDIPKDKLFLEEGASYTFGALSDPHYGRYSAVSDDDAVAAVDSALNFLDDAGIDFVGISGDLTTGGEQSSLDKYNTALAKHPDMTVLSCIGNHDSRTTVSTSNKSALDTSVMRWYDSITSSYFTVEDNGTVHNKLNGHEILANDALTNPVSTQYRSESGGETLEKTIPGLDFVTEAGGNIFIFLNEIAKTGETYDTDKLVTTGQMDWLEEQLQTYQDKNVFLFFHSFLGVNTLNDDTTDYNNCTGDLKNEGGYSYDLDFKDKVTTTSGMNMQQLLNKYGNVTMFSGHSHWQYAMQELNANLNIGQLAGGDGATLIHLSSVTSPRYIGKTDVSRTDLNGYASEGTTVTVYDDCVVYHSVDFYNGQYEAYATYIVPVGETGKYEPVKNLEYTESSDAITGDEYLEAEDMTTLQLLKSDYNLLLGAAYAYTSKGSENKDGALTDGISTGSYMNTKENKSNDQYIIFTLDGIQDISNLKNFMIYFVNGLTDSSSFNIQLSLDGENYETVGEYTDMTYKTNVLAVDTGNLTIEQFKYVKLNLTGGTKTYGYQIREFAAIGYEKNAIPNTANSQSSLIEGMLDETDYLETDYNLIYSADYTQSTVGSENKVGALTDGSLNGFANTERSNSAKDQEFIIDLGKLNIQNVSNINYFLLYSQNKDTNVTEFEISVSLDAETYEKVGTYSDVDIETTHFDPDFEGVSLEQFRYVKLHLTNGNTGYGYQIKEFAIIGVEPVQYPEITDQSSAVASVNDNLALNKTVYVSSTNSGEGNDFTVLTDGKKDKYWSSDWDNTLTSDYIIIDLGAEYNTKTIGSVLVNFRNDNTFCKDYRIEFSKTYNPEDPSEGFYEVAKMKAVSWEILQKYSDSNGYVVTLITNADVASDNIRYIKINMNGHANYGYQIYEVAVIAQKIDILEADVTIEDTLPVYSGKAITVPVSVSYDNTLLVANVDYRVSYENNINAGTAKITISGIGSYKGAITREFTIAPKNLTDADVKIDDSNLKEVLKFNGKDRTPIVKISYNGMNLNTMADFTVQYKDNFYPGVATVTLVGIGNYTGTIVKKFTIVKMPIGDVTIRTSFDANKQLVVRVNNGSYAMTKGKDYDYTVVTDSEGNITITFKGLGDNYTGTFVKKISAADNPNSPKSDVSETQTPTVGKVTLKTVKNVKKRKIKITWKKITGAQGYQIRYATSRKFKKAKVKTIKKNKKKYVLKKLKRNKKYYVQVRAYKISQGTAYYGKWSKKKKVKITK